MQRQPAICNPNRTHTAERHRQLRTPKVLSPPRVQGETTRRGKRLARNARDGQALLDRISKGSIRRLARRGGVKRISSNVYSHSRQIIVTFLDKIMRDALTYMEHSRRKTLTTPDVIYALKR